MSKKKEYAVSIEGEMYGPLYKEDIAPFLEKTPWVAGDSYLYELKPAALKVAAEVDE